MRLSDWISPLVDHGGIEMLDLSVCEFAPLSYYTNLKLCAICTYFEMVNIQSSSLVTGSSPNNFKSDYHPEYTQAISPVLTVSKVYCEFL